MFFQKFLKISVKLILFATAFTPLIVSQNIISPFIFGKIVFFRSLIELALILFLIYLFFNLKNLKTYKIINLIKNPLIISLFLFLISFIFSVIFAENSYRAFWGDIERGEGLFGMFHFFAFLIITAVIFEKKDWLNYFKISLAVGFIIIFYAFLQYFGIKNFPFLLVSEERPLSFIGNPAFLATHMFFLMIFAVIVFFENLKSKTFKLLYWSYFSLLIIVLSATTIFITATRGAILGLGTGVFILLLYFFLKKPMINADEKLIYANGENSYKSVKIRANQRFISVILLSLIVIFSAAFWSTKDAEIWQKIPGLNRLAKTAVFDINDPSTQFRLITWKLSWEAFKEKPFLGWGPENYIVAYEKYYDPEYATYGESWLDRAHNKIIDVAVMQGIFGLVAYLGIFGAAIYLLFKKQAGYMEPIIATLLISYFVQNLVLFDTIISYFVFFAVLGYLISKPLINIDEKSIYADEKFVSISQNPYQSVFIKFLSLIIVIAIVIVLGYSLYFYNLVPYIQARLFKASSKIADVNTAVYFLKKSMYPYNFAQYNIRGNGIDTVYMNQFFYQTGYIGNLKFKPIADLLIKGIDEIVEKEPYDVRVLIREVEMLNSIAKIVDEKEATPLFKKSEKLMREAAKRAPNRQEVYYHLAFNLAGQKRYEEAIKAAIYAVSLNPNVPRAHFYLALMYALVNKFDDAIKEIEIAEKLDSDFKNLIIGDYNTMLLIYNSAGRPEKIAEIVIKDVNNILESGIGRVFERKYYEETLRYFAVKKDAENFVKVANYLLQFNDLKDDMEVLIDLAQKGLWDIMYSL